MRAMYSAATRSPEFSMTSAVFLPPSHAPAQTEKPTPSLHTGTYRKAGSASMASCRLRCQPSGRPDTKSMPASFSPPTASLSAASSIARGYAAVCEMSTSCRGLVDNSRARGLGCPLSMKRTLDFILNGERVSLAGENPTRTLLTWLREARGLTGTKEGCAEGDCGACTVVLADVDAQGQLRYQPVNACILFLGALEGKEVITVEGLKSGRSLHPVQRAMVDCHGSQCGFCTPGFVMALYAHYKKYKSGATPPDLCDAIAGNLCRCTGYRAILEAGNRAQESRNAESERLDDEARAARLAPLPKETVKLGGFFNPTTVDEFADYVAGHPKATILAGGTDAGLWITKQHRDLDEVAYIGRVGELKRIAEFPDHLEIGAGVTYAESYEALGALHPDIGELLRRLGAVQVRAAGTLAGNIANGSP